MRQPGTAIGRSSAPVVAGVVACVLSGAVGCARSKPAITPVAIALDVPPAPPRVISTPPEPVAPPEASTVERPTPASRPQRASRSATARPEPQKAAEPVKAEGAAEAAATTIAPEAATAPPPLLRTPQTADELNADRRTQEVLGRATGLLDRVDPKTLGAQARQQHETARRFVLQAQQALTERNFVLASYLADKAETLAKGLSR